MPDDFDDLLDDGPPKPKRGRPSNAEREARRAAAEVDIAHRRELVRASTGQQTALKEEMFGDPVSQNFLARVLRMDPATCKTRLRRCKPAATISNRPVYYFHEALPYLVKPKMSAEEFIRTLNRADLPPEINKALWDAQRSRVKYKIEAQEAWETEDVLEVLGEVSMTIKDSLVAVVEEMRNRAKLTDEQTEILSAAVDEIRTTIREKLIEMPAQKFTGSMHSKPMFGVSEDVGKETPETGWLDDGDFGDEDDE